MQQTKEEIREDIIRRLKDRHKKRDQFLEIFDNIRSFDLLETELQEWLFHKKDIPETTTFYLKNIKRIVMTIAIPLISCFIILYYSSIGVLKAPFFLALIITIAIYIPFMFYYWRSPEFDKKLILNKVGIFYEGYWYKWKNIATTHIVELVVAQEDVEDEVYFGLIIGMENGALIDININKFRIKESFSESNANTSRRLSHLIEYYKQQYFESQHQS